MYHPAVQVTALASGDRNLAFMYRFEDCLVDDPKSRGSFVTLQYNDKQCERAEVVADGRYQ